LDRRGEVPKIIYQEPYQEIVLGQEPGGTILEASLANGIAITTPAAEGGFTWLTLV